METETTTWLVFPNEGKAIEKNKSKRAELWESQSGTQVEKLRSFKIEKL